MSLKYEFLKAMVRLIGFKKMWKCDQPEKLLSDRRRFNEKNKIPKLEDEEFEIAKTSVMGFV